MTIEQVKNMSTGELCKLSIEFNLQSYEALEAGYVNQIAAYNAGMIDYEIATRTA
tara:strand:+ start:109 stop:273 length:165 start_codon:yes stop_codon:yes gene_type:complete